MATLNDMNVGDIIKINEDCTAVNYIIVHKGIPSSLYAGSCDGVWVLRQSTLPKRAWDSENKNDYQNSSIRSWINGVFLNSLDADIRTNIKNAIIPYQDESGVQSGYLGVSSKIFLLSMQEVAPTATSSYPIDGAALSYFSSGNSIIAKYDGSNVGWWTRSPVLTNSAKVWAVSSSGAPTSDTTNRSSFAIRPAFILPYNMLVNSDGTVIANTPPTITSDKTGNLGTLTEGFTCNYSVNDANTADSVMVTLTMDGAQIDKFTATKGNQYTYSLAGDEWLKITNGNHTFKISATDGKSTTESTATFARSVNKMMVTLSSPLEADDRISACSLKVEGSIPDDAVCVYEVTNNALDDDPVWEDCTEKSMAGAAFMFTNKTAENGYAFSFRVKITRGDSGEGGYITSISGGFE